MLHAQPMRTSPARGRGWKPVVGTLAGVFLGGVFLVAVYAKALDPVAFAEAIHADGLDFLVPSRPLAWILLGLEAAIGLALVLNLRRLWVLVPTALLVAFFLYLTGKVYLATLRGEPVGMASCGCFGNLVDHTPEEAFWRDVILLVPALSLSFLGRPSGRGFPRARAALVAVFALAVGVFAWKAPDLPLDDVATHLRPGTKVADLCAGRGEDRVCLTGPAVEPGLAEGTHIVVIADLADPAFIEAVNARADELFERSGDPSLPQVLVLHSGERDGEATMNFPFLTGGALQNLRYAPRELLRPLYRSLPRTFLVEGGTVLRTWSGFPPLDEIRAE